MAWILDLDGVVWLERHAIPGSAAAVDRLRRHGHRVVFATNFSFGSRREIEDALAAMGIDPQDDVCTSAMAAARLVTPGERVHVLGGPGIVEACTEIGAEVVPAGAACDVVVVGFTRDLDFDRIDAAFQALRGGARLVATNTDRTYPTPTGPIPGGGVMVAAVETVAAMRAVVAGKPHQAMADLVTERIGSDPGTPPPGAVAAIMVGDRPSTDGRFAATLGVPFGLVHSGVTGAGSVPGDIAVAHTAADLAELVDALAVPA